MNDEEKDQLAKEKDIAEKFMEVYGKIKKEAPSKKNKEELEAFFIENKGPSLPIRELSKGLTNKLIEELYGSVTNVIGPLKRGVEEMRIELGYDNSSTIERLLIDDIIMGFFRLRHMQMRLHDCMAMSGTADKKRRFVDQMVSSAQRRFYKSIQTLNRLRKTGINLQINIATEGGKQVNIKK